MIQYLQWFWFETSPDTVVYVSYGVWEFEAFGEFSQFLP